MKNISDIYTAAIYLTDNLYLFIYLIETCK